MTTEFRVDAMSCGHCVRAVTEAVRAIDADAGVEVDLASHTVRVDSARDRAVLAAALTEAGYPPAP